LSAIVQLIAESVSKLAIAPPSWPVLLANVELTIETVPPGLSIAPPAFADVFPTKVELWIFTTPPVTRIPPPELEFAWLSLKVQPVTERVPEPLLIAPPEGAELSLSRSSVSFSSPRFSRAPPGDALFPSVRVSVAIVAVTPLETSNRALSSLPLMVSCVAPGPKILRLCAIVIGPVVSVIGLVTCPADILNSIESPALALVIA
jgi:hypothetical protein